MSNLIDKVAGMKRKSAVEADVERSLAELARQESSIDLSGAAEFHAEPQEKRVSVTVKPVLRSVDVETGDDVKAAVQRLVGGEVKVTLEF